MSGYTVVQGDKRKEIRLFALSTCGWCRKTKDLLNQLGVEYVYVDVDLLGGEERESTIDKVKEKNPKCTFPTLVIDDATCIIGFKEDEIREAVG